MYNKPKISFVCPVFQGAPFIAKTIETIIAQTMKEWEFIIVDDGSTDSLPELMAHYIKTDNRIKYYRFEDNKGAARCRNFGNKKAQADIICVVDCGDLYPKNKARLVYSYFKNHPKIGVFSTGVNSIDPFGNEIRMRTPRPFTGKPGEKPTISHPTASYRKWIALKWPYRETSKATDNYEAFFLTLARNGIKFGATGKIYLRKILVDCAGMDKYKYYRDIAEARRVKKNVYVEFGIPIPEFLEKY